MSQPRIHAAVRRWASGAAAIAVASALVAASLVAAPAAPAQAAGTLTVTGTPAVIKKRERASDPGFDVAVSDTAAPVASEYILGGVPAAWTVTLGGKAVEATSPEPLLYTIDGAAVRSGKLSITPPVGYQGKLSNIQLSRVSAASKNLITDFDNGTFNYDGKSSAPAEALPQLPASNTAYAWKDPSTTGGQGSCGGKQYSPCDGAYSIWPTSALNGPGQPSDNYYAWADLRSVTNPATVPSVCFTKNMIPKDVAATSGKFLVINASEDMPVPNNLVVTTVTGLTPNTNYTFSGYTASLTFDTKSLIPVRSALFAGNTLIGSTGDAPRQASCNNADTSWIKATSVVNTGSATSLTLGVRNAGAGGVGNDLGVDELSLYPMDTATFSVEVTAFTAGLAVAKTANPASGTAVSAGGLVTYSVRATNTGDATLTGTTVTDNLSQVLNNADLVPGSLSATTGAAPTLSGSTLTWTGTLAPAQNVTLTYQVKLKDDYRSGRTLANTVTGTATDPVGDRVVSNCATGTEPGCVTKHPVNAGVSSLGLAKQATPASTQSVARGNTVTYTLTAANTGQTPLTGVTVRDDLAGVLGHATFDDASLTASSGSAPTRTGNALAWTGDLGIGKTVTITYRVTVKSDFSAAATLVNKATAAAKNPDGGAVASNCVTGSEALCTTTHPVPVTGVSISKDDHTEIVGAGDDTTYDIVVTNTGGDLATGVTVTDVLPDDLTFQSATGGGTYDAATRVVTWNIGSIPVAGTHGVALTATVSPTLPPNHAVTNTATVATAAGCASNCSATDVDRTPAISVTKDDHREAVRSGDVLTYDVVAANTGDYAVPGVVVTDALPANAEFVSASDGGTLSADAKSVTWNRGELPAHSSSTVTVTVKVGTVSAGDLVINDVAIDSDHGCIEDPGASHDTCRARDTDVVPAISVTTTDNKTIIVPGEESTYDVVVTNRAGTIAPRATATDVLPENFEFVSADAGGAYSDQNRTVTWELGDLAPGANVTVHVTGTVTKDARPNDTVTTRARAATDGMCADDLTTLVNECEASDTDRVPAISIVKDDGKTIVRSGQTVEYTLTASNLGDDEATNVVIRDTMPDNVDFVKSSLTATQSLDNPLAFEWNVGTIAPGATRVVLVTAQVHEGLPADTTVINTAAITTEGVCVENPDTEGTECESVDTDRLPSSIWITKDDHKTVIQPGEELVYDITVGNNSAEHTLTDAVITDTLPGTATFVSASDSGEYTEKDGLITWQLPSLEPGATTTVQVTVTAAQDLTPGGTVRNMATVSLPDGCAEPQACTAVDVDEVVNLAITKDDHKEQVEVGESLTYDLTVTNRQTTAAVDVVVKDDVPLSLTFVSATDGGSYDPTNRVVTWQLGDLVAGETRTVQIVATVNDGTIGLVTNRAMVTSANGCLDDDACIASDTDIVQGLALTGASASLMGIGALLLVASGVFLVARKRRRLADTAV